MAKRKRTKAKAEEKPEIEWGCVDISLRRELYDKIKSGEKHFVYREIKPRNCRQIKGLGLVCPYAMLSPVEGEKTCQKTGKACGSGVAINQSTVVLRRGHTATSARFELLTLSVQPGDPEMGAPDGELVINIELGREVI